MSNTQAERVEALMSEVRAYASSYRLVGSRFDQGDEQAQCDRNEADVRASITSLVADNDALKADAARLDWLDENVFSMSMDRLEVSRRPTSWKWTFFAPANTQGSIRSILDAARNTTQQQGG